MPSTKSAGLFTLLRIARGEKNNRLASSVRSVTPTLVFELGFEGIGRSELLQVADRFSIGGTANAFAQVNASLAEWPDFAAEAGLGEPEIARIGGLHQPL